jgi:dihydroneopterin aldolase
MSYAVPMLDKRCIHTEDNITLHTVVGVYEWERVDVRPLVFDLRLESEQPLHLDRTLIEKKIEEWLSHCHYRLLEALAEHLCTCILAEWQCSRVVLGIEKPGALGDIARVGIRINRGD